MILDADNCKSEIENQFIEDLKLSKREIRIDIPDSIKYNNLIELLLTEIDSAQNRNVEVYIRAESKQNIPEILKKYTIENTFIANPIAIIDKNIIWFGVPYSSANFISEGKIINTDFRPIIRFTGNHTAKTLFSFLEMNRTLDKSKIADKSTDNFVNYVLANVKCPKCDKPMMLNKGKKGKFYLCCTDYQKCKEIKYIDMDLIEHYLHRNGGTGQHCKKCNFSLEAKRSAYGIYVQCCGLNRHKYQMDEI